MSDKEIKEAKSLRWLANQFPKVENPKDDGDRLCNCINLYCTNAAELIERQAAEIRRLSTLAELGNTRASDYRVMRDRALKAEAENGRLKKGVESRCDVNRRYQSRNIQRGFGYNRPSL